MDKWLKKGFSLSQIVILTCKGVSTSVFSNVEAIGGHSLRQIIPGKYENDQQVYTEGKLSFDSIRRFKGQQADLVILVDVDPDESKKLDMRLIYCGMTRASVRLEVVGQSGSSFANKL